MVKKLIQGEINHLYYIMIKNKKTYLYAAVSYASNGDYVSFY